eukprot:TRINITY_DN3253_c0_g1_i1.p1 TRINITY_DN3253_c0_g1~~TRINITY_DN3253_c0_g1_i1.p1  ORF type:complete len:151 (+),score=42.44 TRINITY_DN3253_c0_g1_i1:347-799(+)
MVEVTQDDLSFTQENTKELEAQQEAERNSFMQTLIEKANDKCEFYSGSWESLDQLLGDRKFDVILTAETVYSVDSFQKLYDVIQHHLANDGVALVAGKVFYFGVGGGTRDFAAFVNKQSSDNALQAENIFTVKDSHSIHRQILKVNMKLH